MLRAVPQTLLRSSFRPRPAAAHLAARHLQLNSMSTSPIAKKMKSTKVRPPGFTLGIVVADAM
jgi:hypothetical protein